jgi:hypothetical protein
MVFSIKENFIIKILSYVFSFLRFDYILQILYKKFFIYYLFKEKLIFFINELCFVNDTKFLTILTTFFLKFFMFLKNFNLINESSKDISGYVFESFLNYEIYLEEKNVFSLFSL